MYIDFKVASWERAYFNKEDEVIIKRAIANGELDSWDDIYRLGADPNWEIMDNTSDILSVEENGGYATIEAYEDNEQMFFSNAKK